MYNKNYSFADVLPNQMGFTVCAYGTWHNLSFMWFVNSPSTKRCLQVACAITWILKKSIRNNCVSTGSSDTVSIKAGLSAILVLYDILNLTITPSTKLFSRCLSSDSIQNLILKYHLHTFGTCIILLSCGLYPRLILDFVRTSQRFQLLLRGFIFLAISTICYIWFTLKSNGTCHRGWNMAMLLF